jgi:hypothetical protein
MIQNLLQIALSICVLSNCFTIWRLCKALKDNDILSARIEVIEWMIREDAVPQLQKDFIRKIYGTGIPRMAEDTEVAE